MLKYTQVNGKFIIYFDGGTNNMNIADFLKTLVDQILNAIKLIGSDNGKIGNVIDALKNIFASLGNKDAE